MLEIRRLVDGILRSVDPMTAGQIKQRPHYIQVMGNTAPMTITRIVHEGDTIDLEGRDYDFSRKSVEMHRLWGYRMARKALER